LSTTTLKASVGRKPQQPVISPAKKIRPGRCGAATLRLVAANAPTASNQSTSRMGGGCKVQWTPRPRSADRLADHHEHPRAGLCCAGSPGGRPLAGADLRWAGSPAASMLTASKPSVFQLAERLGSPFVCTGRSVRGAVYCGGGVRKARPVSAPGRTLSARHQAAVSGCDCFADVR
jgi:hypothetical protein